MAWINNRKSNRNKRQRLSGWAHTKDYPHKNHPAKYKKQGEDNVNYVTFTHSDVVELPNGERVETIPLTSNINPAERGNSISHVYPKVFKGKRSALGPEAKEFSLTKEDKEKVDKLFKELPVEEVPVTGGAGHFKKQDNKQSCKKKKQ